MTLQVEVFHECNDTILWKPFHKLFSLDALLDFAGDHHLSVVTDGTGLLKVCTSCHVFGNFHAREIAVLDGFL